MGSEDRLRQLLQRAVEEEGYELVHAEFQRAGPQFVLRIFIDQPRGVTLDDCQRVSEKVGVMLDVEDLIPHRYTLEVSSPGLERPLVKEQDYVRFLGRRAKLKTILAINGQRNFRGVLQRCEEGKIVLLEDEKEIPVQIELDNIRKANLLFELKN